LAAAAGYVRRLRGFGEEAFIAYVQGEQEAVFDFFHCAAKLGPGELQTGLLGLGEQAL
jgi:hypothetical protein